MTSVGNNMDNFHRKTAMLIARCFHNSKVSMANLDMKLFEELCHHLNPLAELPSFTKIDNMVKQIACNMFEYLEDPVCVMCNKEIGESEMFIADPDVAALSMTAAMLCGLMKMEQAMKAIVCEKLFVCLSHVDEGYSQMKIAISLHDRHVSVLSLNLERFQMGCEMFNRLLTLRQISQNRQSHVPISDTVFRLKVKLWLEAFETAGANKRSIQKQSDAWEKTSNNAINDYLLAERLMEERPTTSTMNFEPPPELESQKEQSEVVFKEVKLEEPDEPEEEEKPPLLTLRPSPPPSIRTVNKVDKSAVITLANGKKVVRMPAGMRTMKGESLVKYRIATKRPADGVERSVMMVKRASLPS